MAEQHSSATYIGQIDFSGTTHAGLKLNSLTTTQRDALTAAAGMLIYNSSTATVQKYQGGSWSDVTSSGTGITRSVNVVSANTSAGSTASTDYVYLVSGATTITLPTAVSNTNMYTIKKTDSSNTVTIATTSAQTIDGSSSVTISVQNTALTMISDGSNWMII